MLPSPRRGLPLLLAAALLVPACSEGSEAGSKVAASPSPSPSPSPSIVVNPPGVLVENAAFGRSRKRVRRAMRDLKAVNLWLPLTRHLYRIKFGSRLGAVNIPDDGHLADALLTGAIDEKAQGALCDIMYFPNAIGRDLDRWRYYYGQGATTDILPTLRQLWGAVTAHELAHCFPGRRGEKFAEKWEAKALARLRELSH